MALVVLRNTVVTKVELEQKEQKVFVTNKEQLLNVAEKAAPGLADAIQEFYVAKETLAKSASMQEATLQLDDYEGPEYESIAGIDNEYFEDEGEI